MALPLDIHFFHFRVENPSRLTETEPGCKFAISQYVSLYATCFCSISFDPVHVKACNFWLVYISFIYDMGASVQCVVLMQSARMSMYCQNCWYVRILFSYPQLLLIKAYYTFHISKHISEMSCCLIDRYPSVKVAQSRPYARYKFWILSGSVSRKISRKLLCSDCTGVSFKRYYDYSRILFLLLNDVGT